MEEIRITPESRVEFRNNAFYCIGTGKMDLALQREYQEELKLVQEQIGFSHIRGHGLFSEGMAIYNEHKDENGNIVPDYNFTYLDRVMDGYRELGLKPFLELGFMPGQLASGEQTVFYWKGNVTPPKEYPRWTALVQATLSHLMERYGADQVVTWPIEVWNEPNLEGFWKDKDLDEYLRLYRETVLAVKAVDSRFRVGGPAICGVDEHRWLRAFLDYCDKEELPLDFVTRHHYGANPVNQIGSYIYHTMQEPLTSLETLHESRRIIDSYEKYKGMEMHITEFNTSYNPRCPFHDMNVNAAYIARWLAYMGDENASYSYWTFGDVFEESGPPRSLFHGGFGLVAGGCLPKPTFWTFAFFSRLNGDCVYRSEKAIVMRQGNTLKGAAWNLEMEPDKDCIEEFYLEFDAPQGEYCLMTETVDEECCNPLKHWHDLGEPANPTAEQMKRLREGAHPLVKTRRLKEKDGKVTAQLRLNRNGVVYFELTPVNQQSDWGYEYGKIG